MRLTLIRHGQSVGNEQGIIQGQKDYPLTNQGVQEANILGEWLANESIDAIYSSDLIRAYDTAKEIAKHHDLPIYKTSMLREVNFGRFEGLTWAEVEKQYPEYVGVDWYTSGLPDVEQINDLYKRASELLLELLQKHQGERVVAVCHGGFISYFLMALLAIEWKGKRVFAIGNTSMTTIEFTSSKQFVIVGVNESPHLAQKAKNIEMKII